ncbi:MAG: hypothetical protein VKI83_07260 [Synechococcaceae cyanobacterium]|nr:hypothetical protein [Synechococcaceae cyanobacterium]
MALPQPTLEFGLQVLVVLAIACQAIELFGRLRHAWIGDGLAAEFRRELRRRGLLIPPLQARPGP